MSPSGFNSCRAKTLFLFSSSTNRKKKFELLLYPWHVIGEERRRRCFSRSAAKAAREVRASVLKWSIGRFMHYSLPAFPFPAPPPTAVKLARRPAMHQAAVRKLNGEYRHAVPWYVFGGWQRELRVAQHGAVAESWRAGVKKMWSSSRAQNHQVQRRRKGSTGATQRVA